MFVGLLVIVVTVCLILQALSRQQLPLPSTDPRARRSTEAPQLSKTVSPEEIASGSRGGDSVAQLAAGSSVVAARPKSRRRKIKSSL
jgi:glucose/arabinose dehydrogenase